MCLAVGIERLRLAAAAVERDHQLLPHPLAQRIGGRGGAEVRHELVVPTLGEPRLGELLGRCELQLAEPFTLDPGQVVVRQLGQRRAAHERERIGERRFRRGRVPGAQRRTAAGEERLEAVGVEGPRRRAQRVAGAARHQHILAQRPGAQASDVGAQDLQRVRR